MKLLVYKYEFNSCKKNNPLTYVCVNTISSLGNVAYQSGSSGKAAHLASEYGLGKFVKHAKYLLDYLSHV